jgi:uncharacterized protein GlcG (DUF336 family)
MMRRLSIFVLFAAMTAPVLAQGQQGRAAGPAGPPPAPAARIPAPSSANAEKMIGAARAKAAEMNVNLACVVVDAHADIVAALRMDGATFLNMSVAHAKARASAFFGQPSGAFGERGAILANIGAAADQTMLTVQGAVPIVQNNQRVGAIGCSGAAAAQDEDAAKAGLAAAQ